MGLLVPELFGDQVVCLFVWNIFYLSIIYGITYDLHQRIMTQISRLLFNLKMLFSSEKNYVYVKYCQIVTSDCQGLMPDGKTFPFELESPYLDGTQICYLILSIRCSKKKKKKKFCCSKLNSKSKFHPGRQWGAERLQLGPGWAERHHFSGLPFLQCLLSGCTDCHARRILTQ